MMGLEERCLSAQMLCEQVAQWILYGALNAIKIIHELNIVALLLLSTPNFLSVLTAVYKISNIYYSAK